MMLLKMYGLYKQASIGDASGDRPGFTDMIGRVKWDAWHNHVGMTIATAQQQYIDLVNAL